jgi:hypothetical protein
MTRPPLAERAYTAMVALYPRQFRETYGADMVSLLRDQCRDEPHWRVYLRATLDLALTIPHQHVEAHMNRNPTRALLLAYLTVGLAGLVVIAVGGTSPAGLVVGAALALGGLGMAAATRRRAAPFHERGLSRQWWKFLVAGPVLIGLVIVAAGLGVEAWFLGFAIVIAAIGLVTVGVTLGIAHAVGRRHPTPA